MVSRTAMAGSTSVSTGLNCSSWRETLRPASTLARRALDRRLGEGGGHKIEEGGQGGIGGEECRKTW